MDAVAATGLRKSYGSTVALDGVTLSADPGEVLALVGPNGAGKTTLVRCLVGTTEPDDGEARLLDRAPTDVDRNRIGLLPQAFSPPDRLTARELVAYYGGLYDAARDPDDALDEVGLSESASRYEDLSGGQRRRACVATALVNDPDVLFLDEPTTGIDPAGRRAVWRLIEDLASGGTTVIVTTHYMAEAERLADRVALLADGDLVALGSPSDLVAEHGGDDTLLVRTDAPADPFIEAGYDAAETRDGVLIEDLEPAAIPDVVEAMDAAGIPYEALEWRRADLEDVYLRLADERPGDRR